MKLALICLLVIGLVVVADCRWVWVSPDPARRDEIGEMRMRNEKCDRKKCKGYYVDSGCFPPSMGKSILKILKSQCLAYAAKE